MTPTIRLELTQLAHAEGLALPAYQTAHAAGLDLLAAVPEDHPLTLLPGCFALVPTGLTIALPEGCEAQVRPRSGLAAKHVGSSRVDLQACKLEYSIVSPK